MLKSLYPKPFKEALAACKGREEMFNKVNGTAEVYRLLNQEPYIIWKLLALHKKERETFKYKRQKYLISDYH